jgi:hypothetical protein
VILAGGALGDDRVGLAVAATGARGQVDVGDLQVGACEVVDRDLVRAAESVQLEPLDQFGPGPAGSVGRERAQGQGLGGSCPIVTFTAVPGATTVPALGT